MDNNNFCEPNRISFFHTQLLNVCKLNLVVFLSVIWENRRQFSELKCGINMHREEHTKFTSSFLPLSLSLSYIMCMYVKEWVLACVYMCI